MRGSFGSRPYIQNVSATVAAMIAVPANTAIADHLTIVTHRLRGPLGLLGLPGRLGLVAERFAGTVACGVFGAHIFNVAPGWGMTADLCNLDTRGNRACHGIIPAARLVCHTVCVQAATSAK